MFCDLFFTFLSLKNDVNLASKSNKQKKLYEKISFFAGILKVNDENSRPRIQDPDPDPLIRGMDQRIRIHTKMSWIRNTGIRLFLYTVSHTEGRIQPFSRPQKKYLQRIEFL
jgi:hypothetical protein